MSENKTEEKVTVTDTLIRALESCSVHEWASLVIITCDEKGKYSLIQNNLSNAEILWLIEVGKKMLMEKE